eukprot:4709074-Prymnesium_polylepis.1
MGFFSDVYAASGGGVTAERERECGEAAHIRAEYGATVERVLGESGQYTFASPGEALMAKELGQRLHPEVLALEEVRELLDLPPIAVD